MFLCLLAAYHYWKLENLPDTSQTTNDSSDPHHLNFTGTTFPGFSLVTNYIEKIQEKIVDRKREKLLTVNDLLCHCKYAL